MAAARVWARGESVTPRRIVQRYELRLGGSQVWAPYWLNADHDPFWLGAPLAGKGSAAQLRRATLAAAKAENVAPQSAQEWRLLMRRHGLGVDCSGFVYHVLNDWLQVSLGQALADHLLVERADIVGRHARHPQLLERWLNAGGPAELPEVMTLGQACTFWGLDAASWCNVRRLVDDRVATRLQKASELRPGDMIVTSHVGTDDIGVVLSVFRRRVVYADSAQAVSGLGGVELREIELAHPDMGLEAQAWQQHYLYHPDEAATVDGMWRLNVLSVGRV